MSSCTSSAFGLHLPWCQSLHVASAVEPIGRIPGIPEGMIVSIHAPVQAGMRRPNGHILHAHVLPIGTQLDIGLPPDVPPGVWRYGKPFLPEEFELLVEWQYEGPPRTRGNQPGSDAGVFALQRKTRAPRQLVYSCQAGRKCSESTGKRIRTTGKERIGANRFSAAENVLPCTGTRNRKQGFAEN